MQRKPATWFDSGLAIRMRRGWRNTALVGLLVVVVVSTWFAARQVPHPDMFRPIGLWDVGRAEWWAYPLERNAFKRQVLRGRLNAVFALPGGEHVWAVGEGGLIIHSADGGQTWEQQQPVRQHAQDKSTAAAPARGFDWIPSARAQGKLPNEPKPPGDRTVAPSNGSNAAVQQQGPLAENAPPLTRASPDAAKKADAARAFTARTPSGKATVSAPVPGAAATANPLLPAASAAEKASSAAAGRLAQPVGPSKIPELHAVFFANTSLGWAVGEAGTVLATRDGGSTWVPQTSGSRSWLRGVQFAADGLKGLAVGEEGTVLATGDGGSTWVPRNSGSQYSLNAVQFAAGGLHAWAVGNLGTILATRDGGGTWVTQNSGSRSSLGGVHFTADGLKGWAVGSGGTVLATPDGGSTWVTQASGNGPRLTGVHFTADGLKGWAVSAEGAALATRDGGSTWTARQVSGGRHRLTGVQFTADGLKGWAVDVQGTVLATRDGGSTWVAQTSGSRSSLAAVQFAADGLRGWAVGAEGTVLATRDGGSTWVARTWVTPGNRPSLNGGYLAADGLRGWAVGDEGTILTTHDGGGKWVPQVSGSPSSLSSVHFAADGLKGLAVGEKGTVLATRDGGSTWVAQASGTQVGLGGVHVAADGVKGWAVGGLGTVLVTLDGGRTWSAQTSGSRAWLHGVQFAADGVRGWAVGEEGTVLATGDGGSKWVAQTWVAQTSSNRSSLTGVQFAADGLKGWAVGEDGTVLATRDGGSKWMAQASGSRSWLTEVRFAADGLKGWAVGGQGTVLATRDGGSTWTEPAQYRCYWAPWYFITTALTLTLLAGLVAFVEPVAHGEPEEDQEAAPAGGATTLRSDQPVLDKTGDLLGYGAAVQALSSFIRNPGTEPRVTIAVTGEWGTGKSSIMRMLQSDLDAAGYRTAWFNAWHQQQEGRQLSALFNTVRQQAVPRWWGRQAVAALRVRSRLIWGRGWFYKAVAIVSATGCALLLGDMLADGPSTAWQHLGDNFAHHVLQQQRTVITGASLAKLDPLRKPAAAAAASAPASAAASAAAPNLSVARAAAAGPAAPADPCGIDELRLHHKTAEPVRLAVYCALRRNFLWDEGGDASQCGVLKDHEPNVARRCIFDSAADLLATVNAQDKDGVLALWPSEEKALRAAAETLPPPPMFRWLESSLLGGLAGFVVLLFTKGVSVYGLQVTAPLRALLGSGNQDKDSGKEAAGTIERYRAEFGLLCDALGGRLVIFIDDLDRCTPATVNGVLEMTNYLVDVGRCFVVIGAAMDRVARCIKPPVEEQHDQNYANEYLRKLIHIEMPVPLRRAELETLLRERAPVSAQGAASRWQVLPWRTARRIGLALAGLACLAAIFELGAYLHTAGDGVALKVVQRPLATPLVDPANSGGPRTGGPPDPVPPPPPPAMSDVGLNAPAPPHPPWTVLALGLLVIAAGFAWRWGRRNRDRVRVALGGAMRTHDSAHFMHALRLWNPVIVQHDPTPRHVKRFYNRARLFAAYEREEAAATGRVPADDEALVTMAALHHVEPDYLRNLQAVITLGEPPSGGPNAVLEANAERSAELFQSPDGSKRAQGDLSVRLVDAWRAYLGEFQQVPAPAQIARFMDRVAGIHVR